MPFLLEIIMFAKLYERNGKQVLVMNTTNDDDEPCVSVTTIPEGLGLCTASIGFKDNDDGYAACDKHFDGVNEDRAFEMAQTMILDFVEGMV